MIVSYPERPKFMSRQEEDEVHQQQGGDDFQPASNPYSDVSGFNDPYQRKRGAGRNFN
jgi:hypothetical protein